MKAAPARFDTGYPVESSVMTITGIAATYCDLRLGSRPSLVFPPAVRAQSDVSTGIADLGTEVGHHPIQTYYESLVRAISGIQPIGNLPDFGISGS